MIDRIALLSDLQSLLKRLEADLLERSDSDDVPEVREWLRAEYQQAKDSERTAHTLKQWVDDFITQVAAAWVLSVVFARFLEDNGLVDPPRISGPQDVDNPAGSRLSRARDEHEVYFGQHPKHSDRDYLLDVFAGLAKLPATADVFGEHNPLNSLPNWLGPDAVGEVLTFFQKIDAGTGQLVHDFTDAPQPDGSGWNTRFLGDLYQDLSEAARKKYALLQTPDFVEEFILDRTLDPALDEFGLAGFKMIDPACGSGHFLLGAFPRILDHWQKQEQGTNVRELVQRALHSIHGVDINPFAIAIARFRVLLAALRACGTDRLAGAPGFELNLVCGDSLYHGMVKQQSLSPDWNEQTHHFRSENADELNRILREGTYHCVVANPPYITPKDRAANVAYRKLYPRTCHMKYSLAVPFLERILRLAVPAPSPPDGGEGRGEGAGYTGQITANSFMKREFGKKLIESFFPTVDLTHVIDTSGAYIPGHGTPTVILFARQRAPVSDTIRTVMGIRGEPSTPDDPSRGLVWSAIVEQIDQPGSQSDFVSVGDSSRELFHKHPWSIGGGGASELKEQLEEGTTETLSSRSESIGFASFPGTDEVFLVEPMVLERARVPPSLIRDGVLGDNVRDWTIDSQLKGLAPYNNSSDAIPLESSAGWGRYLWYFRTTIGNVTSFGGKTRLECGDDWWTWYRWVKEKYGTPLSITYGEVATHNHFVLDRGGKVFKQTAPVIKLPAEVGTADGSTRPVTEDDHLALLGLLNSSTACFWMKQVCMPKGGHGIGRGIQDEAWEGRNAFNASNIQNFPLPEGRPLEGTRRLDRRAEELQAHAPQGVLTQRHKDAKDRAAAEPCGSAPLRESLATAHARYEQLRGEMIFLQEELDWECYRLYGLLDEDLTYRGAPFPLKFGERSFEILMARSIARLAAPPTTWFDRHNATAITAPPQHWPDDYRELYHRRHEVQQQNARIGLIEQPEYKRRWNTEAWDSQVARALRTWLLDRLEGYFDFDGRMRAASPECEHPHTSPLPQREEGACAPLLAEIAVVAVSRLADVAAKDAGFMEVAEVYRDDPAFNVLRLVEELVATEHVPLLPVLRYKPGGLRKREQWEETWDLQRREDAGETVSDIPVPPKYTSADFISTGGARYWSLRGKLDVPKERWISLPHCHAEDGSLTICWAGYDHLQQATAISAHYMRVRDELGGKEDPRLIPLLAGLIELLPWLKQWHNEIDPTYGLAMGDYYTGFVQEEARSLNLTLEDIKAWQPPKTTKKKAIRKKATRKKKTATKQED